MPFKVGEMIGLSEEIFPGLYGYLLILILIVFAALLLYLLSNTNVLQPWLNSCELSSDETIMDFSKSPTAAESSSRSRRTSCSIHSTEVEPTKKSKTRKRSVRKVVSAVSTTSPSIQSERSSPSSSDSVDLNSDSILEGVKESFIHEKVALCHEEVPIVSRLSTSTDAIQKDSDANTNHQPVKTCNVPVKSHKEKKSDVILQETSKVKSMPSSASLSITQTNDSNIIMPTTATISDVLDGASDENDGGWLSANTKTTRRRRRNKDSRQSESKDHDDMVGSKSNIHVVSPQSQQTSSAEQNKNESDTVHFSDQDQHCLVTESSPSERPEPECDHKLVDDCLTSQPNVDTTTTTATCNEQKAAEQPSVDQHVSSTSDSIIPTPKRKRRNAPRKTVQSHIPNEDGKPHDTLLSSNKKSIDSVSPWVSSSSMPKRGQDKQIDDESEFELIEIPNASPQPSSSSSAAESEFEMNPSIEEAISPPDLSQFPPLVKADSGDPISVTMEPEVLEGGRHPQANKLLKLALGNNNNNNNNNSTNNDKHANEQEVHQRQSTSTPEPIEASPIIVPANSNSNKGIAKRAKARKAD
ncbi:unnamed protein product [Heterobilharzia americana]|nr:unnamed protein product [Heterobilharzia americana]